MTPRQFRSRVLAYWKKAGRHDLPWRKTTDVYRVLVSEVMLQQTQVERVIPYYHTFLKKFPTVRVLANASLSEVLKAWQGLGYNRRARMLHEAAKVVVTTYNGRMPHDSVCLMTLPGVGPYTAGAVAAFSSNEDSIIIETNIRTAVLHHFFPYTEQVSDAEIRSVLEKVYPVGRAREWYAALMDYGAMLKRRGVKRNAQAKGYAKQKAFKGSSREARGAILRALLDGSKTKAGLVKIFGSDRHVQVEAQLMKLCSEGMVEKMGARFSLPH